MRFVELVNTQEIDWKASAKQRAGSFKKGGNRVTTSNQGGNIDGLGCCVP